jgi:hypothetical protein
LYTRVDILSPNVHVPEPILKVELRIVPQSARVDDAMRAIEVMTAERRTASHRATTWRTKMASIDDIACA